MAANSYPTLVPGTGQAVRQLRDQVAAGAVQCAVWRLLHLGDVGPHILQPAVKGMEVHMPDQLWETPPHLMATLTPVTCYVLWNNHTATLHSVNASNINNYGMLWHALPSGHQFLSAHI